jgi:NCAIR mutase (PurE)-related protein
MTPARLRDLLSRVAEGRLDSESALEELRELPFADIGAALVDAHREIRTGIPEVVFGERKTVDQIVDIVGTLRRHGQSAFVTRLDATAAADVLARIDEAHYDASARVLQAGPSLSPPAPDARVAVITAGTADLPVANEAAATLGFLGVDSIRIDDCGVAGLHRLLAQLSRIRSARVAIVIAGMEGALPSVVGGLVGFPVIAVPTSVGYGASFGGLAALLAMMNSCATGVTVVNIDNGFGAAVAATLMLRGGASRSSV